MKVTLEVDGIEPTIAELTKYNIQLTKDIDGANHRWARKVVSKARSLVPKRTQTLKKSIKAKYFNKDGPAATVFPRGRAGSARHLVEYGTGPRTQQSSGRYTGRMKATPYMEPAHKSVEGPYEAEIKGMVDKDVTV